MRFLALFAFLATFSFTTVNAQTTPTKAVGQTDKQRNITDSEFERMIFNNFKINFRNFAYESLNLTSEEIKKMDPLFNDYLRNKSDLMKRRDKLVAEFNDEMSEDNSAKSVENETADFIENYWEIDIASMELKKDYFDRMEDRIGYERALRFFSLENQLVNRLNQLMYVERIPTFLIMPDYTYGTDKEVKAYRNWMNGTDGKVSLSHEYTNAGLNQLVKVAESLSNAGNATIPNFKQHKEKVMMLAEKMTKNWRSLEHADQAREAFTIVATMFSELAKTKTFQTKSNVINELQSAAKGINPDRKLTDQAPAVYHFFEKAERAINVLTSGADKQVTGTMQRTRR